MLWPKDFKGSIIGVYSPHLLLLCLTLCHACNLTEYRVGQECCPLCPSGHHVQKHCSRNANTTCAPCNGSTFNDEPNGLTDCKLCAVCDQGLGVKTVRACTPSSDTVCGVLEGHYCINPYMGGCRAAHKHTACKPGQFIKQPGTKSTDTECEDCQENTYSNGSSTSCMPHATCKPGQFIHWMGTKSTDTECEDCQENTYSNGTSASCMPHTDCESDGQVTARAGGPASDAECGETRLRHHVLWPSVAAVVFIGIIIIVVCKRRKKRVQSYKVFPWYHVDLFTITSEASFAITAEMHHCGREGSFRYRDSLSRSSSLASCLYFWGPWLNYLAICS